MSEEIETEVEALFEAAAALQSLVDAVGEMKGPNVTDDVFSAYDRAQKFLDVFRADYVEEEEFPDYEEEELEADGFLTFTIYH